MDNSGSKFMSYRYWALQQDTKGLMEFGFGPNLMHLKQGVLTRLRAGY